MFGIAGFSGVQATQKGYETVYKGVSFGYSNSIVEAAQKFEQIAKQDASESRRQLRWNIVEEKWEEEYSPMPSEGTKPSLTKRPRQGVKSKK